MSSFDFSEIYHQLKWRETYEEIYADYTNCDSDENLDDIYILSQSPPRLNSYIDCDLVPKLLGYDNIIENTENDYDDDNINLHKIDKKFCTIIPIYNSNNLRTEENNTCVHKSEEILNMPLIKLESLDLNTPLGDENESAIIRPYVKKRKSQTDWVICKRPATPKYVYKPVHNNEMSSDETSINSSIVIPAITSTTLPTSSQNTLDYVNEISHLSYKSCANVAVSSNQEALKSNESSSQFIYNTSFEITPEKKEIVKSDVNTSVTSDTKSSPFIIFNRRRSHASGDKILFHASNKLLPRKRLSLDTTFFRYQNSSWLPPYNLSDIDNITTGFLDTHCHLDFLFQRENFQGTYAKYQRVNSETFPKCYEGCIAIFCDPSSFPKKYEWENLLKEDNVWAAFGCHPHMAHLYNDELEKSLKEALVHPRIVALGEIGLDYSVKNTCDPNIQHDVFRKQLKIALQKDLPLVIHCRDAHEDCIRILKEEVPRDYFIHRHCFTGEWKEAELWLETFPNLYMGLTCLVTFSGAKEVHDVARKIPLERLLLETDAPYFKPRNTTKEGKYSHPGMAIHVAAQVAALKRNVTTEEVLRITRRNTYRLYGV